MVGSLAYNSREENHKKYSVPWVEMEIKTASAFLLNCICTNQIYSNYREI